MQERRVRVLEIGAEGGSFELDAVVDEQGKAQGFYPWTGGAHGYEAVFGEEPAPRIALGPVSWPAVLETYLRPNLWLEHHPFLVHPCLAELVEAELPEASEEARARWQPWVRVARFGAEILQAYRGEHCLHPFIGLAFSSAAPRALRVMTVGINAYVSEKDWNHQDPGWFGGWFRAERHRFDRTVSRDAATVTKMLAGTSLFPNRAFSDKENIFHTNAVKAYLREAEGKRADQVSAEEFERHLPTWHAELDIMAKYGVLPHVVLVFGRPFWDTAWRTFSPRTKPRFEHFEVVGFENASGEGRHHANLIEVEGAAGRQSLALLGLRHPAARAASKATPEWVLSRPDVRELLCLP